MANTTVPLTRELAAVTSQHAASLMGEIKRQSQPRRWPWQDKTVRDLIDAGRADLAEIAVDRSARLTNAALTQRDALRETIQRQSQPRRRPWHSKTAYDRVAEQRAALVEAAAARSAELTEAVTAQRDRLLAETRRQASPRRWPWQEPTLRDKLEGHSDTLRGTVTDGLATASTTGSRLTEQARSSIADGLATASTTGSRLTEQARSSIADTTDRVQTALTAAPGRIELAAQQAADSLSDTRQQVAKRFSETTDAATSSVKAAAMVPVDAVRGGVEAGQHAVSETVAASKRGVRRGVRLLRVMMWALLFGAAIGILLAPRPGEETRRKMQELWANIMDLIAPSS